MNEYDIIQNDLLGAYSLLAFVKEYNSAKQKTEGVSIPLSMAVLLIVFSESSLQSIYNKEKRMTSFFKLMSNDRLFSIGLQEKMIDMSDQTFKALNLSFALNLISYDKTTSQLYPIPFIRTMELKTETNIRIINASGVLGFWFGNLSTEEICTNLNLKF